jgi:hypothetical protein
MFKKNNIIMDIHKFHYKFLLISKLINFIQTIIELTSLLMFSIEIHIS